jgi:hypothetical protein
LINIVTTPSVEFLDFANLDRRAYYNCKVNELQPMKDNSEEALVSCNYILYDCYIILENMYLFYKRVAFIILIVTYYSMFYVVKS